MDQTPPKSRYVVAPKPVNRRTADRGHLEEDAPLHPQVQQRTRQLLQRHELGLPLAERLAQAAARPARVPAASVAGLIVGTALLPVAALSSGWWLQAASVAAAAALYGWAWHGIRREAQSRATPATHAAPLVDARTLADLDQVLDRVAPELPQAQLEALVALKDTLARLVLAARAVGASDAFTTEDRLYLHECVRRYIPDSLLAYLNVPAAHRDRPLGTDDGATATETLASQLALIQQALDEKEARSAAGAGEALLLQQRFLQAKARRERRDG
jgi:hypothetical protein